MTALTQSSSPSTTTAGRGSRVARTISLAAAGALLALTAAVMPASAASVPAHAGTFSCAYDAAGNRNVTAQLPTVKSFTNLQQVWWFATVYKKTATGWQNMGNTRPDLMTGFANQNGMITGAIVSNAKWVNARTNAIPVNGGTLRIASKGTYAVAGYFWWNGLSTAYTGTWASNFNTGLQTCTFGH